MNKACINNICYDISMPEEGRVYFSSLADKIEAQPAIDGFITSLAKDVGNGEFDLHQLDEEVRTISSALGEKTESLSLFTILLASEQLKKRFMAENIPEDIFVRSMKDCTSKAIECHECRGVWGTFVTSWFNGWFEMKRFALGRFQYEMGVLEKGLTLENGIKINAPCPKCDIHIPSNQDSLTDEVRFDSYKKAYDFFTAHNFTAGKYMVLDCCSWLMNPSQKDFLKPDSNILRFMDDFTVTKVYHQNEFHDGWRVFGKAWGCQYADLPEETSMQKSYKKLLLSGAKTDEGLAYAVFDGKNMLKVVKKD